VWNSVNFFEFILFILGIGFLMKTLVNSLSLAHARASPTGRLGGNAGK
jgi:hypothetical protein